jgi:uncharacterized membrane protein
MRNPINFLPRFFSHFDRLSQQYALLQALLLAIFLIRTFANPTMVGHAQNSSQVRAVLFYSPTCGHCEKVIREILPPLEETYQGKLTVLKIDVTQLKGNELYQNAIQSFRVPDERLGVPMLFIGEQILVGSAEIPTALPGLIETGLKSGGIGWPNIPGLEGYLNSINLPQNNPELTPVSQSGNSGVIDKFMRDPLGNTLAVVVLVGMIASVVAVTISFINGPTDKTKPWPVWVIPLFCLLGIGVAIYLTFVETTGTEAVCGPVGDCNAVQKSPYAILFGFLPVGILGLLGYLAMLATWAAQFFVGERLRKICWLLLWGFAWFGVLFSIYLTFLEPFVIGATCIWCISSAIIITFLLWATTPSAKLAMQSADDGEQ